MDNPKPSDNTEALENAQNALKTLLTQHESMMLATINEDGSPLASYAPFVVDSDKNFYVFVSLLSHHTKNLLQAKQASIMLIADETDTSQIFARSRLTFMCDAEELARDSDAWQAAAEHYDKRFSKMFGLLRNLADFKMFKLVPQDGTLVVGFGQAYTLYGDTLDQLTLRRE